MVRLAKAVVLSAIFFLPLIATARPQASTKGSEPSGPSVPVKLQVVFREYAGSKVVKSTPYSLYLLANDSLESKLNIGVRFPWITGGVAAAKAQPRLLANTQFQYSTDHTTVQSRVKSLDDGQFKVYLIVIRASAYPFGSTELARESGAGPVASEPAFGDFNTAIDLLMRDGQTIQAVMATDPVSGRVLKVDVTLHVVKNQ